VGVTLILPKKKIKSIQKLMKKLEFYWGQLSPIYLTCICACWEDTLLKTLKFCSFHLTRRHACHTTWKQERMSFLKTHVPKRCCAWHLKYDGTTVVIPNQQRRRCPILSKKSHSKNRWLMVSSFPHLAEHKTETIGITPLRTKLSFVGILLLIVLHAKMTPWEALLCSKLSLMVVDKKLICRR